MKTLFNTFFLLVFAVAAFAQNPAPATPGTFYGETFNEGKAIPATKLAAKLETQNILETQLKGTVTDVCTKKGCWMKLDAGNGQTTMVKFKDYGFFVPADIKGKKIIMNGIAKKETVSVEDQKHYAEDGGKSKEEIAKITQPKTEVSYEAKGVLIL